MQITEEQMKEMREAAIPLIKWINDNCHPHCEVRVDNESVTLKEAIAREITTEFIQD